MKKNWKKIAVSGLIIFAMVGLTGCSTVRNFFKDATESFVGLTMSIRTYDEQAQIIDQIEGKSVSVSRDTRFDSQSNDGTSNKDSKVLKVSVGGKEMIHVGSSLIAQEKGMVNYFDDYSKTVNLENYDRSTPIVNNVINSVKNEWSPSSKVLLIRSQQGYPLATYIGNRVNVEASDVPSSTSFLIDGKRLFVYRCDYTVYDMSLFK